MCWEAGKGLGANRIVLCFLSSDGNKFGQKLMERMGWEAGKGLGAKEDGSTEHVKVKHKADNRGESFQFYNIDFFWKWRRGPVTPIIQKLNATTRQD